MVVTMFSISLLACASSSGIELTSTPWFGINCPAAFNAATAVRAEMHALRTTRDSISTIGGSAGRSL